MPLIQDIAVVNGSGDASVVKSALNIDARNVTDPEKDLPAAAWMAHQYMLGEAQRTGGAEVEGAEPGATWVTWRGTLAHALVELQIGDPRNEDEFAKVRKAVSFRLRDHGNAVCLVRGGRLGRGDVTQWAVRTVFRESEASNELPVFKMTASYLQPMPMRRTAALPRAESHDIAAAIARTTAPASVMRADSIPCPSCGTMYHKTYLGRHFYTMHANPTDIAVDIIRQRGTAYRAELAEALSLAAAGAIISPSYVATVLAPVMDEVPPRIHFHKGFGGDCYYIWQGDKRTPAAKPVTPAAPPATSANLEKPARLAQGSQPASEVEVESLISQALNLITHAHSLAKEAGAITTQATAIAQQLSQVIEDVSITDAEREELIQLRLLRDQFRKLAAGR